MTLFQWLSSALMVSLVLMELVLQFTGRTRRIISSLRASVWLLALFLILVPSATNRVAEILSIGRGADVILYLTVITFLLSFFYLLHAVESQREQITLLVRRIALQNPYSRMPTPPAASTTSQESSDNAEDSSQSWPLA
jgi:hypothetical protein